MEGGIKALLIKCPDTGKAVLTGLFMNTAAFLNLAIDNREVRCPHCGHIHVWSKKDAHLAGEQA